LVCIINYFIFATNLNSYFMETRFSEKESLELIGQMISTAKNNLQKGMGSIFLLWGYLVAGISLVTFILLLTLTGEARYNAFWLWFLMAAGYPLHYRLIRKREAEMPVTTYIDKVMNWVWIAFAASIMVVVVGMLAATLRISLVNPVLEPRYEFFRWFHWLLMTPVMLCLYGFALFVSGKAYSFKPLVTGGVVCWFAALLLLVTVHSPRAMELQQIVLCLSVIAGYVIPGHLLNKKDHEDVQGS